jgi:hypothetical protein
METVVFTLQEYLLLKLDTGISMSTATNKRILAKSPTGVVSEFSASSDGNYLVYSFDAASFNDEGVWQLQASAEIDAKKIYGQIVSINVKRTLED